MIIGIQTDRAAVERGIYDAIRRQIVSIGYLPDIYSFDTGNPVTDAANYKAACDVLRPTLPGQSLIDIRGIGTGPSRDTLKMNTISVNRYQKLQGDIGNGKSTFVKYKDESNNTKFNLVQMPEKSDDLIYEIRWFTDSTAYDRLIEQCVDNALGQRTYIKTVNADKSFGGAFLLLYTADTDLSQDKYFERAIRYTAKDLWLTPNTLIRTDIAPMSEIEINFDATMPVQELPSSPPS